MKPVVKASQLNASELARDVSVLGRKIPVDMMTLHLLSMQQNDNMVRIPISIVQGFGFDTPTLIFNSRDGNLVKSEKIGEKKIDEFLKMCQEEPHPAEWPKDSDFPKWFLRTNSGSQVFISISECRNEIHTHLRHKTNFVLQQYIVPATINSILANVKLVDKSQSAIVVYKNKNPMYIQATGNEEADCIVANFVNLMSRNNMATYEKVNLDKNTPLTNDEKFRTYQDKLKSYQIKDIPNRRGLQQEFRNLKQVIYHSINELSKHVLIELEADYVIDEHQNWYLINVKGYTANSQMRINTRPKNCLFRSAALHKTKAVVSKLVTTHSHSQSVSELPSNIQLNQKRVSEPSMIKVLMNLPKYKFMEKWTKSLNGTEESELQASQSFPDIFNFPPMPEKKKILNPFGSLCGSTAADPDPIPIKEKALEHLEKKARYKRIRQFIKLQNNSLYNRIHYQEELSAERRSKNLVNSVVQSAITSFEDLQAKVQQERIRVENKRQADIFLKAEQLKKQKREQKRILGIKKAEHIVRKHIRETLLSKNTTF